MDKNTTDQILMFSGYALLALAVILSIALWFCRNRAKTEQKSVEEQSDFITNTNSTSPAPKSLQLISSEESKSHETKNSPGPSNSLVILTSPEVNGLRFEDLLKAPAELIGRGKRGSLFKVVCEQPRRMILAVKRIKGWEISGHDFKMRMQRLDELKHPNVLPAMAFYSSREEKLLVYEFQNNGSLQKLLQESQTGHRLFEWTNRLNVAASTAGAIAYMHRELESKGTSIPHGNLKSSNILFNPNMHPCISEYGLKPITDTEQGILADFKDDVYGFGVILLELLTGKNNKGDLANWVVSVLKEEWTAEVFDRALIREGISEERMVNLLQIALKCVNVLAENRPTMNQVALKINDVIEEDERSFSSQLSVIISP